MISLSLSCSYLIIIIIVYIQSLYLLNLIYIGIRTNYLSSDFIYDNTFVLVVHQKSQLLVRAVILLLFGVNLNFQQLKHLLWLLNMYLSHNQILDFLSLSTQIFYISSHWYKHSSSKFYSLGLVLILNLLFQNILYLHLQLTNLRVYDFQCCVLVYDLLFQVNIFFQQQFLFYFFYLWLKLYRFFCDSECKMTRGNSSQMLAKVTLMTQKPSQNNYQNLFMIYLQTQNVFDMNRKYGLSAIKGFYMSNQNRCVFINSQNTNQFFYSIDFSLNARERHFIQEADFWLALIAQEIMRLCDELEQSISLSEFMFIRRQLDQSFLIQLIFLFKIELQITIVWLQLNEEKHEMSRSSQKPVSLYQYAQKCKKKLSESSFAYFSGGSDDQITLGNNIKAYQYIRLIPRVLVDINSVDLRKQLLGQKMNLPFGVSPFAMQKLLHQKKQMLIAKQASLRKAPYTVSLLSSASFQQIAQVSKSGFKMMQIYFMKNPAFIQTLLQYLDKFKFKAIVITVDSQISRKRRITYVQDFSPAVQLSIFKSMGIQMSLKSQNIEHSFVHNIEGIISWVDIKQLKKKTKIPIVLKGILSPEDALRAHYQGVDAIWLSNHGGRQLDTVPATIMALPLIKKALNKIGSKIPVYIDGGIYKGSDIFKCLALGADFVFLGRGFLYSLIDGQQGIKNAFDILEKELTVTMQLCGVCKIADINQNYVSILPQAKI